ncbi:hypothetical protein [Chitinophaga vietnamensis]|uniref:hypothetical protein n=1 Tax=Chitinophaga vietnamensis TaxID=2593957 RepID=UPI00117759C4|nr:hypothetical protein [Chitinophaga vietnamensis]
MQIYISEESILREIQQKFSEVYPHLRLEFYKNPHERGDSCPEKEKLDNHLAVDDVRTIHTSAWVDIGENVITGDMEQAFYDLLGLSAQVFRRAGKVWIETTSTDVWTLAKQEAIARQEYARAAVLVK